MAVTDVLFLCTGNDVRSRVFEALLRHLCRGNPELTVHSAGWQVDPASGTVDPMVRSGFPAWEDRIRFWAVKDLGDHPLTGCRNPVGTAARPRGTQ